MSAKLISLVRDFTATPGARFISQGRYSGEEFRTKIILPALNGGEVILDLNGALGLPPSFLDEAIGVALEKQPEMFPRLKLRLDDNATARSIFMESLERRLGKGKGSALFFGVPDAPKAKT